MILFVDGVFFWESCMWFCLWTEITHSFELILFSFCYTLTFLFLFAISISLKVDNVCEWVVEERGRSFRNIPRSSHLRASAHLRPQPSPDGSAGFCPLSFFFFFTFIVMIWLILKLCYWVCILVIWLCLSLEMFERKIVYCYDL